MQVRRFKSSDADELAALFYESIKQVCSRDYTPEQIEAWASAGLDLEKWSASFEGKVVFVAEHGRRLMGFGELEPDGHIDRFYVAAGCVARGVGKCLYEEIEREARRLKLPRLFVEASITARPFFEKRGFTLLQEQTVTVKGVGLTNFRMEKLLNQL